MTAAVSQAKALTVRFQFAHRRKTYQINTELTGQQRRQSFQCALVNLDFAYFIGTIVDFDKSGSESRSE
jgi:hypothetical protein